MMHSPLERLLELVRRRLGAAEVYLVDQIETPAQGDTILECDLPDGRRVRAILAVPPRDLQAERQKMALLVDSFRTLIETEGQYGSPSPSAPPPRSASEALDLELEALAERCGAADALVIDASSPIIWGDADEERSLRPSYETEVIPLPRAPRGVPHTSSTRAQVVALPRSPMARSAGRAPHPLSDRALSEVRRLPELDSLCRGSVLRHAVRGEDFGYVARSFGGIYVVVLVFDHPFSEIAVERALVGALPRIEGLVAALPPLDPEPAGAAARARRRR